VQSEEAFADVMGAEIYSPITHELQFAKRLFNWLMLIAKL